MKRPSRVRYYKAAYRNDKLAVYCTRCERKLGTMLGNGRILGLNPCWPCRWLKVQFSLEPLGSHPAGLHPPKVEL